MKRDLWEAKHFCTTCNIKMEKRKFIIEGFPVRGWECHKCQETALHSEDAQKMFVFNKLKHGLPVKIGELGNSLILRLPKEMTEFYHISKGEEITLKAENFNKIGIEVSA